MIGLMFSVWLAVFAAAGIAITSMKAGPSKHVKMRLRVVERESAVQARFEVSADIRQQEPPGRIVWLNRWMVHFNIAPAIRLFLCQAGVKIPAERLLVISAVSWAAGTCAVFLRTHALAPSILVSAGFVPLPWMWVVRRRAQRFAKLEQQLPEALDMLVSALRVGHSLITAIGAVGQEATEPLAGEFRKIFDEQNFGVDPRIAMTNLATRAPLPDVRIFVAAALIQKESGGNLAEVLAKVAQTTRSRFRLRKQIMVHTAQGRLTGLILSLLPLALGIGMYLVNPAGMSVLWKRPIGLKMLWTALGMIVAGWLIIRKIVRIRV